ncbi:MAG TPA: YceI family protein, partial [Pyrinomonadaceae bacterium]|nr:YceI family protein [Pyrinomonadaceae bacterium]
MLKATIVLLLLGICVTGQTDSARQYRIDTNHSTVGFSVSIMNGLSKVNGKFTDFTVNLTNDEKNITNSSVSVAIKAASIDTGIADRDNHLRKADFFDAEKYPEITFQSKCIERKGKQLIALGTFTMHGVSKEIALPFTITGIQKDPAAKKMNIGYSAHLTLNRRDYGMNWQHQTVPNFVGDNVEVEINLITRT